MYSSPRVLIGFAVLLTASMIAQSGFAVPMDYSTFPHLNNTITATGDNLDVEGFPIFGNDYFAVCNQNTGLIIYQVTGQSLAQISTFSSPGQERDLEVRDWYGYLATSGGLGTLSLAAPQTPVSLGFLSLPGGDIHCLDVSGTHAFVACGSEGLAIVDITQPSSMYLVGWYGDDVEYVHTDGDRVGVIHNGRFELLDVSNPEIPSLLGFCESTSFFDYMAGVVQGNIVYAHAGGQVDRWDFSDPSDPILDPVVPHIDLPITNGGTLKIQGAELQVTGAFYLGYFDYASGDLLRESSQVWLPRAVDVQAGLRVASANDALHIFSEGTLANPEPLGVFDPDFIMVPEGIMMGDVLYGRSLTQARSITAVDLNAEAAPLWEYNSGFVSGIKDLVHRGDLLAMLSWAPHQVKLATVSRYGVVERGSLGLPDLVPDEMAMAFLGGDHLVVYDFDFGSTPTELRILDISDPDHPMQVNTHTLTDPSLESDLWATDNVILVGSNHFLTLLDAQDPLNILPGADLNLGAQSIFLAQGHLYSVHTALHGANLKSWDISDPHNPSLTHEMPLPVLIGEFVSHGSYAYQQRTGLILDLTNPSQPVTIGNLSLANPSLNTMEGIIASDQYLLIGDLLGSENYPDLHYIQAQGGTGEVSSVPEDIPAAVAGLGLQASPNPFNPRVSLKFNLDAATETSIDIFDVKGRKVAVLGTRLRGPGLHELTWDGTGVSGRQLPSGVYLARVQAGKLSESVKVVLAK